MGISKLKRIYFLFKLVLSRPGSVDWLIGTEIKYGGRVTNVPRNKVSPKDPRTKEKIHRGGMSGGDRMYHHGYAQHYSQYLLPYVKKGKPLTLAEVGILKGTGLAIWCDLFKNGAIIGFDIDLGHIKSNMNNLLNRGAFKNNRPKLYVYDSFLDNTKYLGKILKNRKLDIFIDDSFHASKTILNNLKSVMPYLAEHFVYFAEDNKEVYKEIKARYPHLTIDNQGSLTIIHG